MVLFDLAYTLEELRKSKRLEEEYAEAKPFNPESMRMGIYGIGDEAQPGRGGYQEKITDYQWALQQGLWFRLQTEKELEPGVKGWCKPASGEFVGVNFHEVYWHEFNHFLGGSEHEVRERTRHWLNFIGKGEGEYHQ